MTKLNVKKRAFEAPLKLQRCLAPKGQKFATSTIKKTIAIFFAKSIFRGHCVHGKSATHLGCPDASSASRKPLARRKSTAAAWRPTFLKVGWNSVRPIGWLDDCLVWEACWQIQEIVICGCRRRQHWIKNSHDASFGFKWIWKITINSKFHSLLCCFQE